MADDAVETERACVATVLAVFPEICPNFLQETALKFHYNSEQTIDEILGLFENGKPYPKRTYFNSLKRKREASEDPDEEAKICRTYDHANRGTESNPEYLAITKMVLKHEFPSATVSGIGKVLASKSNQLLPALLFNKEMQACDRNQEKLNFEKALADGDVVECGCCFGELARNRAVCCQKLDNPHLFCVDCARRSAEHAVGQSRYELTCMSMDQCKAGFSREQRQRFLGDKLSVVLERIENETILRMAGIENLERCPFCPYAAEYPPIETDREFRCDNPDCQKVSCRLCKEDTHVPKTCEEAARDKGIGARHEIEEAMSAALIRKCNKCGTPFIKENGCNKMTCTAANCRNIQCYVCSKSCNDYSHFNDGGRGGKVGNCPLFDDVDINVLHKSQVKAAEDKARLKVLESNRGVDKDFLKFNESDHKPRRPGNPAQNHRMAGHHPQGPPSAPRVHVAQQPFAAMPVLGQNVIGQQPGDNLRLFAVIPQQYPIPGQVVDQAGFPARPPAEHGRHPGMAGGHHFPAPQYQPRPQQPQPQSVVMPGALNIPGRLDIPFSNQQNPNQLRLVRPAAPFGSVNTAQPQPVPAPAPRELERKNHWKAGARGPKSLPAMQEANVQPVRMPEPRKAEQQDRHMNEGQLSARPEAQPWTAPAPNLNKQAAQQSRNLAASQRAQLASEARQTLQAMQARLRAQQQAQRDLQVRQAPYQPAIVQAPGGRDMPAQSRQSHVQEYVNRGFNGLNPDPPGQPPAPDRPKWLMSVGHQGMLTRSAAMRQRAEATKAGGSIDEPLELD
ncbi:RING finger protein [Colletotrichum zoysiae]|uniref:RING finger protein n=1 Tax=Colletotrichum zoysiae TaxID=1216348 RepID=A0AAD9LYD8_9PEZI|nr:RING finger protein [Colletotrichum zoysiae]